MPRTAQRFGGDPYLSQRHDTCLFMFTPIIPIYPRMEIYMLTQDTHTTQNDIHDGSYD